MNSYNSSTYGGEYCSCVQGNIIETFEYSSNKWCCMNFNGICSQTTWHNYCTGKAIPLQEQCSSQEIGYVCNHYPLDPYRNRGPNISHVLYGIDGIERSYVNICNDGRYELKLEQNFIF